AIDDALAEGPRHLERGRLVAGLRMDSNLRPLRLGDLALQVPASVRQAALAMGAREALLDGPNQSGSAVRSDEQRIGKSPSLQVLEERPAALGVLLRARRQVEQQLRSVGADAPGAKDRLARLAGPSPLGDAADEEVDDGELGQVARGA